MQWGNNNTLKLPQAAFSGPSRDDILNALSLFFGSPVSPEKLADYSQVMCKSLNPQNVA